MNLAHDLVDRVKGVADIVDIIQAYVHRGNSFIVLVVMQKVTF